MVVVETTRAHFGVAERTTVRHGIGRLVYDAMTVWFVAESKFLWSGLYVVVR